MVSRKQRVRTIILVIILAAAIVGGVFAISYFKVGVTFPWQVTGVQEQQDTAQAETHEESKTEPKLVVKEAPKTEKKKETKVEDTKSEEDSKTVSEEEITEESTENIAKTGQKLDYYGALHVEDGKLYDEVGNEVRLSGVSSNGLTWYPQFITADAIKSLRDNWGINVFRLAMYTSDYNGYCVGGAENQDYVKDIIDDIVKAATDNEMYVIIDWHISNDSNPNEYKSDAIQFFGEMVRKYESNDNVIYEICNEPSGDTTWEDVKSYAKEVIPVIRRIDRDALILVGTPEGCTDLDSVLADPLDFNNIMYTYHFNAGTQKSSQRNVLINAVEEGLPVFVSQYSYYPVDGVGELDEREAIRWNDLMDDYNLSSCIWNLSNSDEGAALINQSCDKYYDFEYDDLSEQGKYFFDKLSDNRKKAEIPEKDDIKEVIDSKETKKR